MALRRAAAGVAGFGALGCGAFYASDPTTAQRTFVLYSEMAPVIIAYRVLEQKQKLRRDWNGHENPALEDAEWAALHDAHAAPTVACMRRMLGSYVKLGQFLALRPDIVPDVWTKELRTLENAVPPQATALVHDTICRSYNVESVNEIFKTFDDTPLGSASIGQVHRATLLDGREVAVKVQYGAGNEKIMRDDIRNGKRAATLLAPEQVAILDEIEAQFATEFDYRAEAKHLAELCTKDVLVMSYMRGENLVDGIQRLGDRAAAREGVPFETLKKRMIDKFEREGYPEPYAGPSALALDAFRVADRCRCALVNCGVFLRRAGARLRGAELPAYAAPLLGDFNPARVMSTLCAVHGHELLVDGLFNGDPHAGNFLLLENGAIGCIDYGQVKRLSDAERHWLCRCYVALATEDVAKLRSLAAEIGMRSRYNTDLCRVKMLTFSLDRDGKDVTDGLNFQQFMDKMYALDPWDEVVPMIVMPSRLCVFIRGIGLMMNHPISCTKEFLPIAKKVLEDEGVDY
ncbi:hypothetical protein JL722_13130 [Aureococcus anophagefferens]|nr:hypothetical protein JL722_13130 [Aureococcus anophagefferens]